jgi:hypothetical protein
VVLWQTRAAQCGEQYGGGEGPPTWRLVFEDATALRLGSRTKRIRNIRLLLL